MLEARVKWLTALLVQHYEGFHPDLVALNRQPTGNQRRVKYIEEQLIGRRNAPLASLRDDQARKKRENSNPPLPAIFTNVNVEAIVKFFPEENDAKEKRKKKKKRETNR